MQVISVYGYDAKAFVLEYTKYKLMHSGRHILGDDKFNAFRCVDNHIRLFSSNISAITHYMRALEESNTGEEIMTDE